MLFNYCECDVIEPVGFLCIDLSVLILEPQVIGSFIISNQIHSSCYIRIKLNKVINCMSLILYRTSIAYIYTSTSKYKRLKLSNCAVFVREDCNSVRVD